MNTKKVTISLLVAGVAIWIGWDIYVAANATPGDTISEIMLAAFKAHPIIAIAIGIVIGHLAWPQRDA